MTQRTYGRVYDSEGIRTWVEINSESNGNFDYGYATTLIQTLKLNLGESPFHANYGIPAQRSVIQQVFPDYYTQVTQQQFSQLFASLQISKVQSTTPTYNVNILFNNGTPYQANVAV